MRFRFVHAADLHLDTPFQGLTRADEEVARQLRDASLQAFDALVALTLAEEAAFLVLAGDVYDGPRRGLRAQLRLWQGLKRLADAGVAVFAVRGNHDLLGQGWGAAGGLPDGVTVFGAEEVGCVAVERGGRTIAHVYGISYARADERRNLARLLRRGSGPGVHLGVLHTNVGGQQEHGNYAPSSVQDLAATGMDYLALGHVHRHWTVLAGDPCWAVYPGTLQGRSPAPGELGPKGAVVVECDDERGVVAPPRFVPLDRVRFLRLELDVGGGEMAEVLLAAQRALQEVRADPEHEGRGLVVRLVLTVDQAPGLSARDEGVAELLQELRDGLAEERPFVFVAGLDLRRLPRWHREELRRRQDFLAAVVAQADELRAEPESLLALWRRWDEELPTGVRSLLRQEPEPTVEELTAWLEEAEGECLALLDEEEAR